MNDEYAIEQSHLRIETENLTKEQVKRNPKLWTLNNIINYKTKNH